jgi:hypothetical protein
MRTALIALLCLGTLLLGLSGRGGGTFWIGVSLCMSGVVGTALYFWQCEDS